MTQTEKWKKDLDNLHAYNMVYSNMSNEQALDIVDSIVSQVLYDIREEEQYSSVESMIERALERYRNIVQARG